MISTLLVFLRNLGPLRIIKGIGALALLATAFAAGGFAQKILWDAKYNKLIADMATAKASFYEEKSKAEINLNKQWELVYSLQQQYSELNREIYDDIEKKLERVAADVRRVGDRIVRVCPTSTSPRPASAPTTPSVVAPSAGPLPDDSSAGGFRGEVEPDTGSGGSDAGYDIFPETTALMAEAERNAITCNGLMDYVTRITTRASP